MKSLHYAPLFKMGLAFLLGILLQDWQPVLAFPLLFAGGLLSLLGRWLEHRTMATQRWQAWGLYLLFAGLGTAYAWARTAPPSALPALSTVECRPLSLRGLALTDPKPTPYGRYVHVQISAVANDTSAQAVQGTTVLYLSREQDSLTFTAGDTLLVRAQLRPASSKNQGYLDYLRSQGITHMANAWELHIRPQAPHPALALLHLRQAIAGDLRQAIPDSNRAAIAAAMFVGIKNGLSQETKAQFAATGLSHLLAISGLHVGVLVLGLGYLLFWLPRLRGGRQIQQLLILTGLLGYMLLAGASPAVVRATLMFGLMTIMNLLRLRYHNWNVLAFSAWILMLWEPQVIDEVGFQLSYAAVLGIFWLLPWFQRQLPKEASPWKKHLYTGMGVTMSATLFTTPLVIYYFGTFPTYFLLANLAVGVLIFPLVLSGFATVVAGMIPGLSWLQQALALICDGLLQALCFACELFASLPYAQFRLDAPELPALLIITGQVLLALLLFRLPHLRRRKAVVVPMTAAKPKLAEAA